MSNIRTRIAAVIRREVPCHPPAADRIADKVRDMARSVDHWCESILSLLEPEARKFIDASCPSCGKCKVWKKDGGGDVVQQPALKWTAAVGFECQSCRAHWSPEQTLFFSRLLGFDLPEGVLE